MSSEGLCSSELPQVTEAEEREIREAYDRVAVTSRRARLGKVLHLATDDGKVCGHPMHGDVVHKSFAVYPVGYRQICRECAEYWRRSKTDTATEPADVCGGRQ